MARIFITGSVDGLGRAAAEELIAAGHDVVVHARNEERADALGALRSHTLGVVTGDLARAGDTHYVADQVNAFGRMDAVIHNAGVYLEHDRGTTVDGHARTFAINTLAPFLLTALIQRPERLVYLSSGLHRGGTDSLDDLDWMTRPWDAGQAYADSKLHVTTLAAAIARRSGTLTASVDPGWVPTRMGGPSATGDLRLGHITQTWFATSGEIDRSVSGGYWHHKAQQRPHPSAVDTAFQDRLIEALEAITGERLGGA
ncbi:SDR family NAD(P)-dependent oxidoreductase [Labedella populi]|uniref:SDR family NAD(P)-dependent oxidoreductase n=1 Tax=Labedella populi TaxID=2498850 RepID=A0A444Q3Y9_9MICO|nr:SDR family NAD(P)-dependent oxidoreductase [Labedella populi]RWZ58457.1 SDR family NAD(P)-dependent oxidoreductase [Labedella populi]